MPNQIGSMPAAMISGMITEVVSTITETPSRKQPITMKSSINASSRTVGDSSIAPTDSDSSRGMPVKPIAVDRKVDAARMKQIMVLVRVAASRLSLKPCNVSVRVTSASTSAPITPTAAASVAVAIPP